MRDTRDSVPRCLAIPATQPGRKGKHYRTAPTPLVAPCPSGWPDLGRHRAAVTAAPGKASNQFPAKSRCHCQRAAGHCQAQGHGVPEARNEEVVVLRESSDPAAHVSGAGLSCHKALIMRSLRPSTSWLLALPPSLDHMRRRIHVSYQEEHTCVSPSSLSLSV